MRNLFDLTGKTALITGASSGLGEQFAHTLSKAGARVLLAARQFDKLKALAESLPNALAVEMDVAKKESVHKAFTLLEQQGERIDIALNNAGIAKLTPIFDPDPQSDFEAIMQTNVMGVWYVTKAVARHMKDHTMPGSIINIASVNGDLFPKKEAAAYSISKAAIIHLTKMLVGELSPYKIRINCISPGLFHTPLTDYQLNTQAARQKMEKLIPLHFVASTSDMDGLLLYLASSKASAYVTGACFTIDGGISWRGS